MANFIKRKKSKKPAKSEKKQRKGRVRIFYFLLIGLCVVLFLPVIYVALTAVWDPPISPMQLQRILQAWEEGRSEKRQAIQWKTLDEIPQPLIHYIWASEDQLFFEHDGFDFKELEKAIQEVLDRKKGGGRGASTITMQAARSVYLWQGRSYIRKALEAYFTIWMEFLLSKQRILELYLNHIELGRGVYGVGAGAEAQFGKPISRLTKSEMLAMAAILPNPREWSAAHPNEQVYAKIRRLQRLSSNSRFPLQEIEAEKK
ncbi:MAG: monofunctional biosynthetic peptidoglycan transglycosylase [Chthoniobacterales bacterium]